jgi:hypothetical protein
MTVPSRGKLDTLLHEQASPCGALQLMGWQSYRFEGAAPYDAQATACYSFGQPIDISSFYAAFARSLPRRRAYCTTTTTSSFASRTLFSRLASCISLSVRHRVARRHSLISLRPAVPLAEFLAPCEPGLWSGIRLFFAIIPCSTTPALRAGGSA